MSGDSTIVAPRTEEPGVMGRIGRNGLDCITLLFTFIVDGGQSEGIR